MTDPLPVREIREIIGDKAFVRLYGQDTFLYISDAPRRMGGEELHRIIKLLHEGGWITRVDSSGLLLIDLAPARWEALLGSFPVALPVAFPQNEALHGVYALARLLQKHPAGFAVQPMEWIRGAMKRLTVKGGLIAYAPQMQEACAALLRLGQPLPSALENVFNAWLTEQSGEVRI